MTYATASDWRTTVPSHWRVTRLKFVADVRIGVTLGQKYGVSALREYPYLRVANVQAGYVDLTDLATVEVPEAEAKSTLLRAGDVLMTEGGDLDKLGRGCVWRGQVHPCVHQNHVFAVRPHAVSPEWLSLWTGAAPAVSYFENRAKRTTNLASISATSIKECPLPLPPEHEQRAIVAFLNREMAKIDAMIAAKQRLLDLLAEKRRALISHTVTRGLNPNTPLRDSGIEWLGRIPAHWETERAKWLFRERDERSAAGEEELLTVSHITGVTPRSEKNVNMFEAESMEGYKLCYPGDLAVNTLWAWMGAMGVSNHFGIVSPAYNVYVPSDRLVPAYVEAVCRTQIFADEARRHSTGVWSSRLRLYPEGLFEIGYPVPPRDEQNAIVEAIQWESTKADAMRGALEKSVRLLYERRAALITAAVTGEIDVETAA